MNFKGAALKLGDLDLPYIGSTIGVGEDEIHAVIDVEAAGSGFDSAGRPKMLFEPHVFYRNLSGAKRDRAVAAGLAYAKWKSGAYPKDSYPRLTRAMEIDETAALKACSWGMGQILGENYKAAGFSSPQAMVESFCESEGNQLNGMISFIKNNKLDDELRRHDWAGFARGYNGPQYAKHGYHTKLAAAYAKWSKIPDTHWDGKAPPIPLPPKPKPKPGPVKPEDVAVPGAVVAGGLAAWLASNVWIFIGITIIAVSAFVLIKRLRKR